MSLKGLKGDCPTHSGGLQGLQDRADWMRPGTSLFYGTSTGEDGARGPSFLCDASSVVRFFRFFRRWPSSSASTWPSSPRGPNPLTANACLLIERKWRLPCVTSLD